MGGYVKFSPRLTPLLDRVLSELWNLDFDLRHARELVDDTVSKGGAVRADIGLVGEYIRDALGCLSGARSHLASAMDEQAILAGKRHRPTLAELQALNAPPATTLTDPPRDAPKEEMP